MRRTSITRLTACLAALTLGIPLPSLAATFTGTVTDKTTGKPSSGDSVSLVDVQAGMTDVASGTTSPSGHYSLDGPGIGPYLVRVTHQGAAYFIAAPQGGSSGDVTVYDVAPKVDGVSVDADMLLFEAGGGVLRIRERYLIRNTSLPPRAQFGGTGFEVAIPPDAELDGASATRPGGMSTVTRISPLAKKGHYAFNIPIQPDQGEKETLFELQYHLPYSGKYTFSPVLQMAADNFVVYAASGITFSHAQGAQFQATQQDPRVQTFVARDVHPGQMIHFTVDGEGQMAPDTSANPMSGQASMASAASVGVTGSPGGGLGVPIDTPDPLTRYKWWLLIGMILLLLAAGNFLLRRRDAMHPDGTAVALEMRPAATLHSQQLIPLEKPHATPQPPSRSVLLHTIKEELFEIEREKLTGSLAGDEYSRIKTGLEALLKRELKKSGSQ